MLLQSRGEETLTSRQRPSPSLSQPPTTSSNTLRRFFQPSFNCSFRSLPSIAKDMVKSLRQGQVFSGLDTVSMALPYDGEYSFLPHQTPITTKPYTIFLDTIYLVYRFPSMINKSIARHYDRHIDWPDA